MHTDLEGKCAIVCAASRGLGKATALALAREGASVTICGRDATALDAAAADIARAGSGRVLAIPADLSRAEDIDRLIRDSAARLGGIDVLVTNTGGPKSGPFETLSDDDWRGAIDSLLMSVVRLSRACVPHLRARGGGRIINVTSVSVKQPIDGLVLSNALRAAVTGLSRTLANELAPDGILVNCVAPGYTRTARVVELNEAAAARAGTSPDAIQRALEEKIPLGRLGTPEEFADVVTFLASSRAGYVTGITLQVDGGFVRSLL